MLRVIACGDRNWSDRDRIKEVISAFAERLNQPITIVDGSAKGADSLAHSVAEELGLETERYPAAWSQLGKRAGPIRNQEMLDQGVDFIIAFHSDLDSSKGTKDMVARAHKKGVPCYLFS